MTIVVLAHLEVPSVLHLLTKERFGVFSAPELFILISGILVGLIYHARIDRLGWKKTVGLLLRRAAQLYLISLGVSAGVYLLRFIPAIDATVLSTFTEASSGTVYDLYANPDGSAFSFLLNKLTLRSGPGQFIIIGLYVVLMAIAPVILWLLKRRLFWLLALLSGSAYVIAYNDHTRLLPSQFENAFSLLAWQLLFVAGVSAGFHWDTIKTRARPLSAWLMGLLAVLVLGFMLFSLNNPWIDVPGNVRLTWIDAERFTDIYRGWFSRVYLGPGRVVNALIVVAFGYLLLTHLWKPVNRVAGWFFLPVGQASLFVFVIHLGFVLLFDQIDLFRKGNIWINALGSVVVLLAIWSIVRLRDRVVSERRKQKTAYNHPNIPD